MSERDEPPNSERDSPPSIVLRLIRIPAIASAVMFLFSASQNATIAQAGEPVPGIKWALGVVSVIFLASALFAERMRGPEATLQKDGLWGLGIGGVLAIIFV